MRYEEYFNAREYPAQFEKVGMTRELPTFIGTEVSYYFVCRNKLKGKSYG